MWDRRPAYNNTAAVAESATASAVKTAYYCLFAVAYFVAGGFADAVMVNSSWTKGHIDALWRLPRADGSSAGATVMHGVWRPLLRALGIVANRPASRLVYPPCNVEVFAALPLSRAQFPGGGRVVVSVAQFRPEKDHALQLRAFAAFRKRGGNAVADVRLLLIGGCRDEGDAKRVEELRSLARELQLLPRDAVEAAAGDGGNGDGAAPRVLPSVEFMINAPFTELERALGCATAALHTMWNEHFGISVVEAMAAGALPIAHASGGPKADIVVPLRIAGQDTMRRPGFLAATVDEYADALLAVVSMPEKERLMLASAGRTHALTEFSDDRFQMGVYRALLPLVREGLDAAREHRRADAEARRILS